MRVLVCQPGGRIGELGGEDRGELGIELNGEDRSEKSSGFMFAEVDKTSELSHGSRGRWREGAASAGSIAFYYEQADGKGGRCDSIER